jgi:hypothetical protein
MKLFLPIGLFLIAHPLLAQPASQREPIPPRTWDTRALADWATPLASINIRPGHFSEEEYYRAPIDNYRTYPVYRPDREPPGYWDALRKKRPERWSNLVRPGQRSTGSGQESVCGTKWTLPSSAFTMQSRFRWRDPANTSLETSAAWSSGPTARLLCTAGGHATGHWTRGNRMFILPYALPG